MFKPSSRRLLPIVALYLPVPIVGAALSALWNVGASAYFEGKDDPNIAVLHFDVTEGQYWDAPSGRLGSLLAMAKAKVSGAEAAGEHGSIATN